MCVPFGVTVLNTREVSKNVVSPPAGSATGDSIECFLLPTLLHTDRGKAKYVCCTCGVCGLTFYVHSKTVPHSIAPQNRNKESFAYLPTAGKPRDKLPDPLQPLCSWTRQSGQFQPKASFWNPCVTDERQSAMTVGAPRGLFVICPLTPAKSSNLLRLPKS